MGVSGEFNQESFGKPLQENIGMLGFGNTFLKMEAIKIHKDRCCPVRSWGVNSPINVVRQTNTNKAGVQEGKMLEWLRWRFRSNMAYIPCRSSSIPIMQEDGL